MRNLFAPRILPPFNAGVAFFILMLFTNSYSQFIVDRNFDLSCPSVPMTRCCVGSENGYTYYTSLALTDQGNGNYLISAVFSGVSCNSVTVSVPPSCELIGHSLSPVPWVLSGCSDSGCSYGVFNAISVSRYLRFNCNELPSSLCSEEQIATIDSAYFTGTHANPPRYELFKLPSGCPKTVIPASQMPDSWIPWIDNELNEQLNVAVSFHPDQNIITEGWGNSGTPAIFVAGNQTMEQLGCETEEEGFVVFCSDLPPVPNPDPPSHWICREEPCPGDRPTDTLITIPPSGGGGSSSSGNGDFNSQLRSWKEMLEGVIRQNVPTPPNPLPLLQKIYDKIVDFKDFVVDLFDPQEDPHTPNDDLYNVDDPTTAPEIELPPEYKVDTIIKYDSLSMEDEDIFPDLEAEFKKKLDSIKTPDKDSIKNELIKNQEKQLNETFDKIVDKVNKAMEPVYKALPKGDGACNCLADSFMNLSFGVMKGTITVGSMVNTKIICENISIIRRIIMVIVAITCLGMILATLRR